MGVAAAVIKATGISNLNQVTEMSDDLLVTPKLLYTCVFCSYFISKYCCLLSLLSFFISYFLSVLCDTVFKRTGVSGVLHG